MEELWHSILHVVELFVIPDWAALVSLIPFALAGLVFLWLALTAYRYATLGPSRRGPGRIKPLPPPGVHMPHGSYAPILGAAGTGLLLGGLVAGGILLWAGLGLLVAALLYWGREALHEYELLEPPTQLPAVVHAGPPPGVHIPAPSFRPFLAAIATFALLGGLVAMGEAQPANDQRPPAVVLVAVLILAWSLVGWLRDARLEYVETAKADRTGHLEALHAPGWPKATLGIWLVLLVGASLYQFGVVPPRPAETAGGPGASPGASGEPSPGASAETSLPPGTLEVRAEGIQYTVKELTVTAGQPFAIHFINADPAGVFHDVDIRTPDGQTILQDQATIDGGTDVVYQYTALEAGEYRYICSIHPIPQMTGTLTVR
jgi:plastocyanin